MAGHATTPNTSDERLRLGDAGGLVFAGGVALAIIGTAVALILGWISDHSLRRFFFAYTFAYCFFLSISLGSLIMVLMQFLTRAAWSVSVRRVAENLAGLMPVLGILALPIIATVALETGTVYRWALPLSSASPAAIRAAALGEPEEAPEPAQLPADPAVGLAITPKLTLDSVTLQKRKWMNPAFWIIRVIFYLVVWSAMAMYYRRLSLLQDTNGDEQLTRRLQYWSGICVVIVGLTLTGAAGDLLMSLDPHWYSTIFGIYFFAGCTLGSWALIILIVRGFQKSGYLTRSITTEHYQDLGKYLFAFTFFWGYIAFGQYMLLWYSSIPEEIEWFSRHGATTVTHNITGWSWVILAILFGQLIIPFGGLMSRHVKRRIGTLIFWACWLLAFHLLDIYWMVMPEYYIAGRNHFAPWTILVDLAALVGMGGVMVASMVRLTAPHNLRPTGDPRLPECLAFQNM